MLEVYRFGQLSNVEERDRKKEREGGSDSSMAEEAVAGGGCPPAPFARAPNFVLVLATVSAMARSHTCSRSLGSASVGEIEGEREGGREGGREEHTLYIKYPTCQNLQAGRDH